MADFLEKNKRKKPLELTATTCLAKIHVFPICGQKERRRKRKKREGERRGRRERKEKEEEEEKGRRKKRKKRKEGERRAAQRMTKRGRSGTISFLFRLPGSEQKQKRTNEQKRQWFVVNAILKNNETCMYVGGI